ncbi:ABC transporter permease [Fibrobacterota bacterium]
MKVIAFLKEPGSIRIIVGSFIVVLLIFMALFGNKVLSYTAQYMDPEYIMEPPSLKLFRSFLITEKGLRNLGRYEESDRSSGALSGKSHDDEDSYPQESSYGEGVDADGEYFAEEEEDLSYLAGEESREESSTAGAAGTKHSHYFGTDRDGRDLLALLVAGAKSCILPGLLTCLVALGLGIPLGITGGYYGGRWAEFIQFLNSVILSFPRFVLILVVICALEPNVYITMVVLGLTIVPRVSELMRNRVRALSNMGFVLAARESGLSDWKIMARHLFWFQNRTMFFVQASIIMSESILVETTLSYLQFGTKPPDVSWGNIIEGSRLAFFSEYYWITFFPAVAIVTAILGFFYLGDGLNARLEYRERK